MQIGKDAPRSCRIESRRRTAKESHRSAAECIGKIERGMSLFAVTRGAFSAIDVITHILQDVGPSHVGIFTWTLAQFETSVLIRLRREGRILSGVLVIDASSREKYSSLLRDWHEAFGSNSIKLCINHSKMVTIESATGLKVLVHGSLNLNANFRLENLQVLEGGPEFDLVKQIEAELPVLPNDCSNSQAYAATGLNNNAFDTKGLKTLGGLRTWQN